MLHIREGINSLLCTVTLYLLFSGNAMAQTSHQNDQPELQLPEFIGHRGASWLAPENTLASITLAWEMDADAVEIDVYLTADNEIILFHDTNTNRITGRDRAVEEQNLAELLELDAGAWKAPQWEGEKIITLSEALATVPGGKRIFVEAKSDSRIVEPMLDIFDQSGLHPHQMVVIAFSYELAVKTKRLRPRTPVYWLVGFNQDNNTGQWTPSMEEVVKMASDANLEGVNLGFSGPATVEEDVARIRDAGLGFYIWTVNDVDDARRAIELGVDGITTDRPAWLKKQLLSHYGWNLMQRPG